MTYKVRESTPDDFNFVKASFLRGVYYGETYFNQIPKDIFMRTYSKIVDAAWSSPDIRIRVACLVEDPTVIVGYSVCSADDKAIAWVFVKSAWRKLGIGQALLPPSPQYAVHMTEIAKSLISEKYPNIQFNPFY